MHPSVYAKIEPNKPAYIMAESGETVTYQQLNDRSNQVAQKFRALGLKKGDHVSVLLENNRQFFEIIWGAQRSGLIYTAISTHLKKDEIAYILNNSDAEVLITSQALADTASLALESAPVVTHAFLIGESREGFENYDAAFSPMPTTPVSDQCCGADMLYSSGTTGRPKGVTVSLSGDDIESVPAVMSGMIKHYNLTEDSIYLSPAPLYHAAPLRFNMLTMFAGGTSIIMEKFNEETALKYIEKYRATHSQWVPIMFVRMLKLANHKDYDISSMQCAIHAAAPCPVEVKKQMIDWWGPIIHEFYSCTEGVGLTFIDSHEWLKNPGSVGKAVVGKLHILDDEGKELPPGEVGNIFFSDGPTFSYHKDPEKTKNATNDRGWFSVGDIGYLNEEGYLYLTDRKSFMIISGGVNIYPQEIENLLITHPNVADVAVIGVPDEEFGETVKAVVQPVEKPLDIKAFEDELLTFCRTHIASIKCPKSVDLDHNLPRFPNGKLYKKQIRARYWPQA